MVMCSHYLDMVCTFDYVTSHAISFEKALFDNEFRSLHTWRKADISNRRPDMCYDVIYSLPAEVRTLVSITRKYIKLTNLITDISYYFN